ncbi:MAG: hypothetical protein Ct9H300mP7_6490 [Verrucomicrobiota bacterium]|nr:MAG: hypothetical protein Ct9H300mP7_6490 [Verrucomicrobiota bacterium]
MAKFTRNPRPKKLFGPGPKGITSRFYWLQIPGKHLVKGKEWKQRSRPAINITAEKTPRLVVRLSDQLLNLESLMITVNGRKNSAAR